MVLVVGIDEVLQDCAGLPHLDFLAVGKGTVGNGGHAAVRIDGEEPRLLLDVRGEVDFLDGVRETKLLERDGDFGPVGGLRSVQCNCRSSHSARCDSSSSSSSSSGFEEVFREVEKSAVHHSGRAQRRGFYIENISPRRIRREG